MSKPFSPKRHVVFSSGDETYARQHAPRQDIVPNLLTHGLVILSARPKAGKSELVHSIAMAIVVGDRPLGSGTARSNRHSGFNSAVMCDSWASRFSDLELDDVKAEAVRTDPAAMAQGL